MRKSISLTTIRCIPNGKRFTSSAPPWNKTKSNSSSSSTSTTATDYSSLLNLTHIYTISPPSPSPLHSNSRHGHNGWAVPPLYAPTETFMPIPPQPKKGRRRRRSNRTSPLPYHEIPRTLTHHPQEKSPYGIGNRYRGVFLNHLAAAPAAAEDDDTTTTTTITHADVTAGIAATAPVGPITSVTLLRPPPDKERAFGKLRAHVVFGRYQAVPKLVQAAREGVLKIKGVAITAVSVDKSVAYHWNNARRVDSRVLLVRGSSNSSNSNDNDTTETETPGFTERELRAAMEADEKAMKAAGPLGARSEPVVSYEVDGGKSVTMEWRFFSHAQAMAMRGAIERAYKGRLEVYKGWDPCWVDEKTGHFPERLNREQAWRNEWGMGAG